ncbi:MULTISPECIES: hypothetical protein [unclassified Sphingomonas]|uniref:hypothetical protein n=1 Tax=unclassified Sphingomonas TaxID=196159 RepID=UPI000715E8D7|nr:MULTISPECIES: hypothetical protein [unclassified Sphingomonas]KQM57181.1 hypothetical protein ASE65_12675 [Sphingomonas sp. Leaf16]KQN10356.1 hypothetical protein ASE81_12720 [Sphingomonas sp. Leaf29]
MEEIERTIRLPRDADPLESYARHYAFRGLQTVEAVYVTSYAQPNLREGMEVMTANGSRPATPREIAETEALDALSREQWGEAGKRYWHSTPDAFPMLSDGGCDQISILYDVAAKRFRMNGCSGEVPRPNL